MTAPAESLIRNAEVLHPSGQLARGDVHLRGGKIAAVLPAGSPIRAQHEIEAGGLMLLPGGIDPQVHFREPGMAHKETLFSGSCACARGGITAFLEMPNTQPPTTTQAALDDKLQRAASSALVHYGFFIGATADNLPVLQSAQPACGIKIFMGSSHGSLLVSEPAVLARIFASGHRPIAVHAENQQRLEQRQRQFAGARDPAVHTQIRDRHVALLATQQALELAQRYRRRLHVLHVSTAEEAQLLRACKPSWVSAEVTPQHLLLNEHAYATLGTRAQMNPPLRSPRDNAVLWQALQDGAIDFIATDHAPHTWEEKAQGYPHAPSGMPGVETSLPLMLTQAMQGRCSIAQVARWLSAGPAQAYGLANKGAIAPGYDADLVLVDLATYRPVRRAELATQCGWSPFEGWNLTGWPVMTLVGGQIAYERGQLNTAVRGEALSFRR